MHPIRLAVAALRGCARPCPSYGIIFSPARCTLEEIPTGESTLTTGQMPQDMACPVETDAEAAHLVQGLQEVRDLAKGTTPPADLPCIKSVSRFAGGYMIQVARRVFVNNLAYTVSWQDLKDHFRSVGQGIHGADNSVSTA